MNLSDLKETPTHEQELDYQDELVQLFGYGREQGYSVRDMAKSVQQKVFADVKDLSEENKRLGERIKVLERRLASQQGSLL